MIVAANAANAAGDEMSVTRVLVLHENAVAAENGRGAMALDDLLFFKVNFGIDAQAPDDAGDGIPGHFDGLTGLAGVICLGLVRLLLPY